MVGLLHVWLSIRARAILRMYKRQCGHKTFSEALEDMCRKALGDVDLDELLEQDMVEDEGGDIFERVNE